MLPRYLSPKIGCSSGWWVGLCGGWLVGRSGSWLVTGCFLGRPTKRSLYNPRRLLKSASQQFYVGPDRFVVHDVLSVSFDAYIVTISMDRSTHFYLDVSATLGLLQYQCSVSDDGLSLESLYKN